MKIKDVYETQSYRKTEVVPFPESPMTTVTVMQSSNLMDDNWRPAEVNWSAFGATSPEIARKYAEAIKVASDLAEKWTKERCNV